MDCVVKPVIVAIGYNRAESLARLLQSIGHATYEFEDITLIISIDFWKKDNLCYEVADSFQWTHGQKIVIKHEENLGLRRHVLACGDFCEKYGAVILLEDDIVVSEQYYNYSVAACNFYQKKKEVLGIGLYTHHYNGFAQLPFYPQKNGFDSYYEKWVITWGECFCKEQWRAFRNWYELHKEEQLKYVKDIPHQITDWSETSWGKYVYYYMLETDTYFVSPYEAYATNYADIGVHVRTANNIWQTVMQRGKREYRFADAEHAIKYDMFFESMDQGSLEKKLEITGVLCLDLYGQRKDIDMQDYDFCLSVQKLPYKIIKSFALQVRPIEDNIYFGIRGEGIFLYDLRYKRKIKYGEKRLQQYKIQKYYYPSLQYKRTLNYIVFETFAKIRGKYFR